MEDYRKVIGEKFLQFRKERGLSAYALAKKGGLKISQVQAVENGDTNYTIDIFLKYIRGADLYMYFAEKANAKGVDHDIDEMVEQMKKEDPKL